MSRDTPELGKIRIDAQDDFELDLDYYLGTEYDDIGQACSELPPVIEWVNMKLQQITESKLIMKQEIAETEAKAYFDLRAGLFEDRGYAGKPTQDAVKEAVCLEESVKVIHRKYAVLVGWAQRLYQLQASLQSKLDLIRSTEATRRRLIADEKEE